MIHEPIIQSKENRPWADLKLIYLVSAWGSFILLFSDFKKNFILDHFFRAVLGLQQNWKEGADIFPVPPPQHMHSLAPTVVSISH